MVSLHILLRLGIGVGRSNKKTSAIFVYLSLHKNKTHPLLKQVESDVDLLKYEKIFVCLFLWLHYNF